MSISESPQMEIVFLVVENLMRRSILSPLLMTKCVLFSIPLSKREESAPIMVKF